MLEHESGMGHKLPDSQVKVRQISPMQEDNLLEKHTHIHTPGVSSEKYARGDANKTAVVQRVTTVHKPARVMRI